MYKVMYHCAPPYLTNLILNRVRDIVDHNLRNKDDFRNNRPRTEKYKHSIFMDGIRLWNNLPDDVKDLDIVLILFGDKVKPLAKGNELYNGFTREANIAHAQLRMQCSNLNGHLYNLHVLTAQSARAHINVKIAIITCFTVLCIPLNSVKCWIL